MKKQIVTVILMVLLVQILFAEAPEMQRYLPTEWKYMTRYDGELNQKILDMVEKAKGEREIGDRLSNLDFGFRYTVINKYGGTEGDFMSATLFHTEEGEEIRNSGVTLHPNPESWRLYEEKLGEHTFYYYVEYESEEYPVNMYLMYLKDGELIGYAPAAYNAKNRYGSDTVMEYSTYLIPGKQGKIKAVCLSVNIVNGNHGERSIVNYWRLDKKGVGIDGQRLDTFIDYASFATGSFLYDKNNPLKYALFNAFDGDFSTSYVEDDVGAYPKQFKSRDLIWIQFSNRYERAFCNGFSSFKIVNGYAKDASWYNKNNRPKTVKNGYRSSLIWDTEGVLCEEDAEECILADNCLDWQKFDLNITQYFLVKDIYKGTHYTDTCIAELDFKYDGAKLEGWELEVEPIGWLFSSEADGE